MLLIEVYKNNFYLIVIIQIIIKVIINMDNFLDFSLLLCKTIGKNNSSNRIVRCIQIVPSWVGEWKSNYLSNAVPIINLRHTQTRDLSSLQGHPPPMNTNTRFQYYQNIRKLHPDAYWSPKSLKRDNNKTKANWATPPAPLLSVTCSASFVALWMQNYGIVILWLQLWRFI